MNGAIDRFSTAMRALPLRVIARGAVSLDELSQLARCFLLVHAPTEPYRALEPTEKRAAARDEERFDGDRALMAVPIATRPGSGNPVITIGRLNGNDVFLADSSVSKFHAFVRVGDDGRLLLSDAKSRNGTTVNGVAAPTREQGGVEIRVGDVVIVGQLRAHVVDAPGLYALARGETNTLSAIDHSISPRLIS